MTSKKSKPYPRAPNIGDGIWIRGKVIDKCDGGYIVYISPGRSVARKAMLVNFTRWEMLLDAETADEIRAAIKEKDDDR